MKENIRGEFTITGRVQGVGFRYFVYQTTKMLGVNGFVKNQADGSVIVIAEGSKKLLDELHDYLRSGPSRSWVDSCRVVFEDPTGEFDNFGIRY